MTTKLFLPTHIKTMNEELFDTILELLATYNERYTHGQHYYLFNRVNNEKVTVDLIEHIVRQHTNLINKTNIDKVVTKIWQALYLTTPKVFADSD